MTTTYRQGAIGALLDEYERALDDLHQTIADISDEELITIVDNETTDERCKSVQTILAHVIKAGHNYAVYIRQLKEPNTGFMDYVLRPTISDYKRGLNDVFTFTLDTFKDVSDNDLEPSTTGKKIETSWGQQYDIEQITEHAIVHILRHRRQIDNFKLLLRARK